MPALVAGIHVFSLHPNKATDGWNKSGHDHHSRSTILPIALRAANISSAAAISANG